MEIFLALVVGAAVFGFNRISLAWKRLFLIWKLKRICKGRNYELVWFRPPVRSVFAPQVGYDFSLKTEQSLYYVALCSARFRFREYCFISPTELLIHRKIQLFLTPKIRARARTSTIHLGTTTRQEIVSLNAEAPADVQKILLFCPVPHDVTCIRHGKKVFLGNGDEIFEGFHLFTRTAFLRGIREGSLYLRKKKPWETE